MIRLEPIRREAGDLLAKSLSRLHWDCFPDDPWSPQALADIFGMAGFFGLAAIVNELAAGFALAQGLGAECELLSLGVIPARRRLSIGTALLEGILREARCRGHRALFLEVAEDNIAARACYYACGFVQIGRRSNYYRRPSGLADALVLQLLLST